MSSLVDVPAKRLSQWSMGLLALGAATLATLLVGLVSDSIKARANALPLWGLVVAAVVLAVGAWALRRAAGKQTTTTTPLEGLSRQLLASAVRRRSSGNLGEMSLPAGPFELQVRLLAGYVKDARGSKPAAGPDPRTVTDAFAATQGRLLIVGEPGSGKSFATYQIVKSLEDANDEKRIPLVVNLSAWNNEKTFVEFLVAYLCSRTGYDIADTAAASDWVESGAFSLVLDGLDGVPGQDNRVALAESIDQYIRDLAPEVPVIVTCRRAEYDEIRVDPKFHGLDLIGAIELLPPDDAVLNLVFTALADNESSWMALLDDSTESVRRTREALRPPMILKMAESADPAELLQFHSDADVRDAVFESFVQRTVSDGGPYNHANVVNSLHWLALYLIGNVDSKYHTTSADSRVFDLASLSPTDPPPNHRLFAGAVVGAFGIAISVLGSRWGYYQPRSQFATIGAGALTAFGAAAVVGTQPTRIQIPPSPRAAIVRFLVVGCVAAAVALNMFIFAAITFSRDGALRIALSTWIGLTLIGLLVRPAPSARAVDRLTSAHRDSLLTTVTMLGIAVGSTALFCLFFGSGRIVPAGPLAGCVLGLYFGFFVATYLGGWDFLLTQFVALRWLSATTLTDRPVRFLEWCCTVDLLRKSSSGVEFRHDLLRDWFAQTQPAHQP